MNKIQIGLVALSLAAIIGCSDSPSDDNDTSSFSLSGSVIDGYIYNAHVFIDLNNNGVRDDSEPQSLTTFDGSYDLSIPDDLIDAVSGKAILVEVNSESLDVGESPPANDEELADMVASGSATTFFNADSSTTLTLALPPLSQANIEKLKTSNALSGNVITPYTTRTYEMVKDKLESIDTDEEGLQTIDALVNSAKKEMVKEVAEILGVDYSDELYSVLTGDFINPDVSMGDNTAHEALKKHAQDTVMQRRDDAIKADEIASSNPDSKVEITTVRTKDTLETITTITSNKTGIQTAEGVWCEFEDSSYTASITNCGTFDGDSYSGSQYPAEYEIYSETYGNSDKYSRTKDYRSDKDSNDIYETRGYGYDLGTYEKSGRVTTLTFERLIDERHKYISTRVLDSTSIDDFMLKIDNGDLSHIDIKQFTTETQSNSPTQSSFTMNYTESDTPPFVEMTYCEDIEEVNFTSGAFTELIEKYWNCGDTPNEVIQESEGADGSLIVTKKSPLWYGSDTEYPVSNMWFEKTWYYNTDGDKSKETEDRYILDEASATPLLIDDSQVLFSEIVYELVGDYVVKTWKHYTIDGYDFTKTDEGTSSEPVDE
ncbi:hypothetical protein VCHA53O466_140111 [Vibrio chagasii]|nr:hypothetical protein VCHA53O466_140111 [Vibrio chagasii]